LKSRELCCDLFSGNASHPYSKIGIHLINNNNNNNNNWTTKFYTQVESGRGTRASGLGVKMSGSQGHEVSKSVSGRQ